jgi:hypothetical protein
MNTKADKADNDNTSDITGTLYSKDKLFISMRIGEAEDESDKFEILLMQDSSPAIRSEKTGKTWRLDWRDIITLAIRNGVSK